MQRGGRGAPDVHTYLRLTPELRARVNGPKAGDEPAIAGTRHPVLKGFDETDILPYGGTLAPLRVAAGSLVPLSFVPPFPTYPPETSWMRQPTDRYSGPGAFHPRQVADRVYARGPRSPLYPRTSPGPRRPARKHRPMGSRRRYPA